ncbi:MAG: ABC transporter ATP-binding protein [Rectinemataceae bacterium]|nr:ABC transporter ATP-binding protein [Rectinemataceae bacterium]
MITVDSVSMRYYLGREKITNLKEYLIKRIKQTVLFDEFWALRDISFTVQPGEVFGIIGLNGAGKSTLLKLIAGVIRPTTGVVGVSGKISPLIELGAGFDYDLTARENVFLNGAVLGYQKPFLKDKFNEIIEFAELQAFVDVPLKNFSSGMVARLAFSIATLVEPEILIVDEILSVGDIRFQEKSEFKMRMLMESGSTVVFVSHDIAKISEICDKALWLDQGRAKFLGNAQEVCALYLSEMSKAY